MIEIFECIILYLRLQHNRKYKITRSNQLSLNAKIKNKTAVYQY